MSRAPEGRRPTALVRLAVEALESQFFEPLAVDELLRDAWEGAAAALLHAGVSQVPLLPAYPADSDAAYALHEASFSKLEQLADGHLTRDELSTAALEEVCARRRDASEFGITAATSAEAAVRGADVVVTATTSQTPVLYGAWLSPGVHINAVGAPRPDWRELDDDVLERARLYVDSREAGAQESGDVIAAGLERVIGEIGEVAAGLVPGRQPTRDNSVQIPRPGRGGRSNTRPRLPKGTHGLTYSPRFLQAVLRHPCKVGADTTSWRASMPENELSLAPQQSVAGIHNDRLIRWRRGCSGFLWQARRGDSGNDFRSLRVRDCPG